MSESTDISRSWWDIRADAYRIIGEVQEMLSTETYTSKQLDRITNAIKDCHETIRIANEHLGLID